jgi:hypothetical protein
LNRDIDRDSALFVNLVIIFQSAAMQQMGKIMNPITGKVEKSLEQARYSIDILSMLKEKTRGNLSEDLERLLDSALLQLRMNYVEEAAAESAGAAEKQAPAERQSEGQPAEAGPERERQAGAGPSEAGGKAATGKAGSRKGAGRAGRKRQPEAR